MLSNQRIVPDLTRITTFPGPMLLRTRYGRLDVLKDAGGETYETLLVDAVHASVDGVRAASLAAIARMKRAANRPKDRDVLPAIEETPRGGQRKKNTDQRPTVSITAWPRSSVLGDPWKNETRRFHGGFLGRGEKIRAEQSVAACCDLRGRAGAKRRAHFRGSEKLLAAEAPPKEKAVLL